MKKRPKRKILNYMTARIMCLSRQYRWYGNGEKNPFYEYAEAEYRYIINAVAEMKGYTRVGLIIARQQRLWLQDEEKQEHKKYVGGISAKQAYRLAEEMYNHGIQFLTALEIDGLETFDNSDEPKEQKTKRIYSIFGVVGEKWPGFDNLDDEPKEQKTEGILLPF